MIKHVALRSSHLPSSFSVLYEAYEALESFFAKGSSIQVFCTNLPIHAVHENTVHVIHKSKVTCALRVDESCCSLLKSSTLFLVLGLPTLFCAAEQVSFVLQKKNISSDALYAVDAAKAFYHRL